MAHEIADSDDEIELVPSPSRKSTAPPATAADPVSSDAQDVGQPEAEEDQPDPLLSIDFDELCTPTQRLSSFEHRHDPLPEPQTSDAIDSSTTRFLSEFAHNSTSQGPDSAVQDGTEMGGNSHEGVDVRAAKSSNKKRRKLQVDDFEHPGSSVRKRTKNYGSSGPSQQVSEASRAFKALVNGLDGSNEEADRQEHHEANQNDVGPADLVSVETRTQYTSPLDLSLALSSANGNETQEVMAAHGQHQPQSYVPPHPYAQHTTFPNWQGGTTSKSSIGNYQSFTINPGQLGMAYDDINPFGRLSQASLVPEDNVDTDAIAKIFSNSAREPKQGRAKGSFSENVQDVATNNVRINDAVDLPEKLEAHDVAPQGSPSFSPITDADDSYARGDTDVPVQALHEVVQTAEIPAGLSDDPPKPTSKKRGRKPKEKPIEAKDETDVDELASDANMIVQAPRAGTVDSLSNASEVSHASTTSKVSSKRKNKSSSVTRPDERPKKLPSSDLGLDSKEIIGLSPERYQPQPSRSRRGKAVPEHGQDAIPEVDADTVLDNDHGCRQLPTPTTQAKGKKGRKAKVRQANNSIAETLPLPDETDKVDDAVEMQHREAGSTDNAVIPDKCDELYVRPGSPSGRITVDIPVLLNPEGNTELPLSVPEPKKRGRKRKKPVVEPVVLEEQHKEEHESEEVQTVLAEKDVNASIEPLMDSSHVRTSVEDEPIGTGEGKENATPHLVSGALLSPAKSASTNLAAVSTKPSPSTPLSNTRARIGLSKRHSIPSLLRRVNREKEAPKIVEKKEKLNKRQLEEKEQERIAREEAEAEGREYLPLDIMRDKNGRLIEWDF